MMRDIPINDYRDTPAYTVAEAARYLKLPPATLRSWVAGRGYTTANGHQRWQPLIAPASADPALLSFWNLIEAHVLSGLRTSHQVPVKAVREALVYAEGELGIQRLLLSRELCTSASRLFLDHYGKLIDLSASGQIAMRELFEAHLSRVEWDEWQFPVRLFPFMPAEAAGTQRPIAIDPAIAFGRPVVKGRGITTEVLADRIDAGESLEDVASNYGMTVEEVKQAVVYQHAHAA